MVKHTQQFVGNLPTNCLSVFDHFVGLMLKVLRRYKMGALARNRLIIRIENCVGDYKMYKLTHS